MARVSSILYVQFPVRPARWGKDSMLQCIPIRMVNVCALTISPQLAFHFSVDENNRRRCYACHKKPVYHISDMTRNIKDFPTSAYTLPSRNIQTIARNFIHARRVKSHKHLGSWNGFVGDGLSI